MIHKNQSRARLALFGSLTVAGTLGAFGQTASVPSAASARPGKPNILIILADDLGYSDLGCYGSEISTPNLDRLAAHGLRFAQFYTTPKCFPSRASLLTGLYPHQTGMGETPKHGFNHACVTIAELLRQDGYDTWLSGKWHDKVDLPVDRGFDHSYGLCDGATNYFNPGNQRPGGPVPAHDRAPRKWAIDHKVYLPYTPSDPKFYTTDAFTDQAIRYLDDQKDGKPFFLYLAYNAPHYPLQAWPSDIDRYRGRYRSGWDRIRLARYEKQIKMGLIDPGWVLSPRNYIPGSLHRRTSIWEPRFWDSGGYVMSWDQVPDHRQWDLKMAVYAAMVDRMDQDIGRVLRKLEALGKLDNTFIIFLSDNGGCAGSHHSGANAKVLAATPPGPVTSFHTIDGPWAQVNDTPFRYYKDTTYEGGISTPAIVYWHGKIAHPGSITHQMSDIMDVMPTCVEIAGASYPQEFDGHPIHPMEGRSLLPILEGKKDSGDKVLFWEFHGNRAVRDGPWKLMSLSGQPWQLYNMVNDRTELYDLASAQPDLVQKLSKLYDAWAKRVGVRPFLSKKQTIINEQWARRRG